MSRQDQCEGDTQKPLAREERIRCEHVHRRKRNLKQKTAAEWEPTEGELSLYVRKINVVENVGQRGRNTNQLESLIFESRDLSKASPPLPLTLE